MAAKFAAMSKALGGELDGVLLTFSRREAACAFLATDRSEG